MKAAGRQRAVSRSNVSKEVCLKARSQFGKKSAKKNEKNSKINQVFYYIRKFLTNVRNGCNQGKYFLKLLTPQRHDGRVEG